MPIFNVVLFNPQIPPNTGNIMRLCSNTGFQLHLIKPLGFHLDDKSLKRAKLDYFSNTEPIVFEDLDMYVKNTNIRNLIIITKFGNIDIKLFEKTPYHRANFIYLTKKKYFDGTMFHRVVPGFIIQGGNSDSRKSMSKRQEIGRYLLPPDTKKGYSHHRGVISMPSSEIDNPYKLASPYEFFIVQHAMHRRLPILDLIY